MGKTKTSFKPGQGGRPKGVPNKLTRTVKDTVLTVFNDLQEDRQKNLLAFAKKYPRDFYSIAARLIPTEISGNFTKIQVEIVRRTNDPISTEQPTRGTGSGNEGGQTV